MIGIKDQCYGVEVEMTCITREQAAHAVAEYFGTTPRHGHDYYDSWYVRDPDGKKWRFMSDKRYQGRGYGKVAMSAALEMIRNFPCGPAEYCFLSYEPENIAARSLYHSCGFIENGEMDGEEIVAVLKL